MDFSSFNILLYITEVLSIRLTEMKKDGLINWKVNHESSDRIEYQIIHKGLRLAQYLIRDTFSMKYCSKDIFKDKKARTFRELFEYESRQND